MRLLVCGSRNYKRDAVFIKDYLTEFNGVNPIGSHSHVSLVIVGGATGPDTVAEAWATSMGIKCEKYVADWNTYGKSAGPIRNSHMLRSNPEMCIAFWNGESPGTFDMIQKCVCNGVLVTIVPEG